MPNGLTTRQDLQRGIGHFICGEVTAKRGRRLVMFTVDFEVLDADLALLNNLSSGISHCKEILRDPRSKRVFYMHFGSGCTENEMIKLALNYRNKVNDRYPARPLVVEQPTQQRRSQRNTGPKPPPSAQLNFSSRPSSSRK